MEYYCLSNAVIACFTRDLQDGPDREDLSHQHSISLKVQILSKATILAMLDEMLLESNDSTLPSAGSFGKKIQGPKQWFRIPSSMDCPDAVIS